MVDIIYKREDLPKEIIEDVRRKINELGGDMLEFKEEVLDPYCIGMQAAKDGELQSHIAPLKIKQPAYWITLHKSRLEEFIDFLSEYYLDENTNLLDLENAYISGFKGCINLYRKLGYEILEEKSEIKKPSNLRTELVING